MKHLLTRQVIGLMEFRNEFRQQVLSVGDMRTKRGRPKSNILDNTHTQITREITAKIINALFAKLDKGKKRYERELWDILEEEKDRIKWACDQVGQMSSTNREAEDSDIFRLAEKMCGLLITIGTRRNVKTGRPEAVRITTASATPAELRIFIDRQIKKGRREGILSTKFARVLGKIVDAMHDDETFEEVKARHLDAIRSGEPDIIHPVTEEDE